MNFLKSVFTSNSEFSNAAGETPPYNVIDNVSQGNEVLDVYNCNYKYGNLKELEYICLHNDISADKVNENLKLSMIRKRPQTNNRIDQYGNPIMNGAGEKVDFLQSANQFVSLYHHENINAGNNVMINILKVYERFDSFVSENVELVTNIEDFGENTAYLDYSILKLFRIILKNNCTISDVGLSLHELLFVFLDKTSMNIKLYIEGITQNTTGNDKFVFKLLSHRFPKINNMASLNAHLNALLQKNEFLKVLEFINRVNDTSIEEVTQLVNLLSQKVAEICNCKDETTRKMWKVGVIDKVITRYNYLKKLQIDNKNIESGFVEFEICFFNLLGNIIEVDPSRLSEFDFIFLDYIKNNAEGKTNIIRILLSLNVCYEKLDSIESDKISKFPLLLFNHMQVPVRNIKFNNEQNLNIVRLFLLLLKSPNFNSKLADKFICNDVLRLVSEISKQSGAADLQNVSEIKSLNFLIVVLIVSLKDTILSFYGTDRGYTILISAILQNSNIQKSRNGSKNSSSLLYDLAILQILKNEISNWPTELIVTKLLPVQSLINLLLISNENDNTILDPSVAEANKNISQSAFDIYMHIISRVAKENGFSLEDKSKPMFSEIDQNIVAVTDVSYYKNIGLQNLSDEMGYAEIPTIVQYSETTDNSLSQNSHASSTNNYKDDNWSWDEPEDTKDLTDKIEKVTLSDDNHLSKHRLVPNKISASSFANTNNKKSVLRTDTRTLPSIKKKAPAANLKTKPNAFPSFQSDNEEDGWDDDW